jgi:hypothetical protein
MRNSGWYIPYWRKPKKKGRAERQGGEDVQRNEEQLEAVRHRWVERYRRTLRSLGVMGLSVGSNRAEVQARYEALRAAGTVPERELEDAYRYLVRVLPPLERRKRRNRGDGGSAPQATTPAGSGDATGDLAVAVVDVPGDEVEDEDDAELDEDDVDEPEASYGDEDAIAAPPLDPTHVESEPRGEGE